MPLKKNIANSLLKHNFLPVQKKNREEIPPIFVSVDFDEKIAKKLINSKCRIGGYDQVEYLSTRFNNVPRLLAIPHPIPYSFLSLEIKNNWDEINQISKNESSIIKPKSHKDGRIIIMDYDQSQRSAHRHLNKSLGKKYVVHTDIANFFNSIYTHSIPWALAGFDESKKNKSDHSKWYNKLDKYQRLCKRDETIGLPIGPATSNILAECILKTIDDILVASGYTFIRFIDDYTAYCNSNEDAEKFISDLSAELKKYKLSLNLKKTFISDLPISSSADWVVDLSTRVPKTKKINYFDAIRFLDYAVKIQKLTPDGSILKYAIKTISKKVESKGRLSVAKYALNLAYQNPIVIPLLDSLILGLSSLSGFDLENKLVSLLNENLRNKRSDGVCWTLFILKKHCSVSLPDKIVDIIIKTEDCLSITTLYAIGGHDTKVIDFAKKVMKRDLFSIDEQWLLLYQLFYDKKIVNPYENETLYGDVKTKRESNTDAMKREIFCFKTLRKEKVSFIDSSSMTHSKTNLFKAQLLHLFYSNIRKKLST